MYLQNWICKVGSIHSPVKTEKKAFQWNWTKRVQHQLWKGSWCSSSVEWVVTDYDFGTFRNSSGPFKSNCLRPERLYPDLILAVQLTCNFALISGTSKATFYVILYKLTLALIRAKVYSKVKSLKECQKIWRKWKKYQSVWYGKTYHDQWQGFSHLERSVKMFVEGIDLLITFSKISLFIVNYLWFRGCLVWRGTTLTENMTSSKSSLEMFPSPSRS